MSRALDRIAAALERLAPPPPPAADLQAHPAYLWTDGGLRPTTGWAPLPLDLLVGVDRQAAALSATMRRLAAGLPAHDALLWGARGTGKSALVKAAAAAVQAAGGALALAEVPGDRVGALPALFAELAGTARAWAVFLDDLGFADAASARQLRSLLEGGAQARPANVRLFVTANHRHLIPRHASEQADPLSPRDALDDQLALADRFGLSLGFHAMDQADYLRAVAGYLARAGLPFEPADALAWAAARGARSGRVAWQYATECAGRAGSPAPGDRV